MKIKSLDEFKQYGRLAYHYHLKNQFELRDNVRWCVNRYISENYADRKGTWTVLSSGRPFWPEDPRPEDFTLEDIASSLSRVCRFGGHLMNSEWNLFSGYSVAQHSVLGSHIIDEKYALHFLLHDGSESMFGDVTTPVKRLIASIYNPIEDAGSQAIAKKFGFEWTVEACKAVKSIDNTMLATEIRDTTAAGFINVNAFPAEQPMRDVIVRGWSQEVARSKFLERFHELTNGQYVER